ncbi:MORN repeat-containing protein 3 isoform X2 [Corvus kubaryi]|uniref:MORN repeat-containing protein 3 isoform X2 n=1 Tax=Corvus kubaryi TaxID=68294 RepID=UPI001C054091|nr:MORN repeat-containing protein 3 isoform X2 [Corvus kubaryi]
MTDTNNMPVIKYPRIRDPLFYEWDRKAQKCGLRHTIYAVNGDQYTGEWLDNLKHGKGTQLWKNTGAIYSGDWKFGKRDGYGSYSIPDPVTKEYKRVYTGWWENDRRGGQGVFFYPNGECYEGEWSNGLRSGWGKMQYKDGSVYEGQWLVDQPNGQGVLRLPSWLSLQHHVVCPDISATSCDEEWQSSAETQSKWKSVRRRLERWQEAWPREILLPG